MVVSEAASRNSWRAESFVARSRAMRRRNLEGRMQNLEEIRRLQVVGRTGREQGVEVAQRQTDLVTWGDNYPVLHSLL